MAAQAKRVSDGFREVFPEYSASHYHDGKPGQHRTITIDYAVVLVGEMTAVLDEQETVLRVGDILIQRGTNHTWRNKSGLLTRMLYVLIDGQE